MSVCVITGYCYNPIVIHALIIVFLLSVFKYWLSLFHGVIIFWCFMKSWRYLWILIPGNYITLNTFFPNTEEIINCESYFSRRDARWFSCLRHGATSRQVAGSIPDGVIGIFCWGYPSCRTMTLGSTHSLTEMSNRNISRSGRCVRVTTLPPSWADSPEIREPQPTGTVWACTRPVQGLLSLCFASRGNTFLLVFLVSNYFFLS
jgi:hypothetical protein